MFKKHSDLEVGKILRNTETRKVQNASYKKADTCQTRVGDPFESWISRIYENYVYQHS